MTRKKHQIQNDQTGGKQGAQNNTLEDPNNTLEDPNNTLEDPNNTLEDPNNTLEDPNNTLKDPNNTLRTEIESSKTKINTSNNDIPATEKNTCKYCLNNYSNKKTKNKHEKNCKFKEDPVRLLELENDIIPELPESKTECRFCNKIFCRIDVLNRHFENCKERKTYKKHLIKEKQINIQTQNNYNNCNNVNNFILNFGQTNDNTKIEEIIELLRVITKEYHNDPEQAYLMAGSLISKYDNLLMNTPENRNLVIPDSKCLYCEVKIPGGWEMESIDDKLHSSFKDRANKISEKQTEIDDHNERVFKSKTNQKIFSEVKQFANKGFRHCYRGEDLRKVKTGYKINKLKNKLKLN